MKENSFLKKMTAIMGSFAVLASVSFVAIDNNNGINSITAEASAGGQVSESGSGTGGGGGVGGSGDHAWGVFRSGDHGGLSAYRQIEMSHSWGNSLYQMYGGSSWAWGSDPRAGRNVSQDLANASARGPVNCRNADVILNYATRGGPGQSVTHNNNALRSEVRLPNHPATSTGPLNSEEWNLIRPAMNGSSYVLCANWGPAATEQIRNQRTETDRRTDTVANIREFEAVISRQAEITPGINFSGDIGETQLHAQTVVDLTPFGIMREAVRCGNTPSGTLSLLRNNNTSNFISECGLSQDQVSPALYSQIRDDARSVGSSSNVVTARNNLIQVIQNSVQRTNANTPNANATHTETGNGSAPWVRLTEQNQIAFAEGGVLNVMQREQRGQIRIPAVEQTSERTRDRREVWLVYEDGRQERSHYEIRNPSTRQWEERSSTSNFGWSEWSRSYTMGNVTTSRESYRASDFFQMLSVKCNVEDFERLLEEVDGTVSKEYIADSAGTDRYRNDPQFSGIIYTDTQNLRNGRSPSRGLGAGSGNMSNDIEFYTKECNFQCEYASSENPTHRIDGSNPGSFADAVGANPTSGERFGYRSGGATLNELTFVSNNESNPMELRATQPRASSSISLTGFSNNGVPTRTIVSRWSEGTPGVTTDDGTFTMRAFDDNGDAAGNDRTHGRLFRGNDNITLRHDQGSPRAASSSTVEILDGAYNKFDVRGNWASTSDRPETISVAWGYEANIQSVFNHWVRPGGGNEMRTRGSGGNTVTTGNYGRCHAEFRNGDFALNEHLNETTGVGVDYESIQDDLGISSDSNHSNNLILRFTNQVAER